MPLLLLLLHSVSHRVLLRSIATSTIATVTVTVTVLLVRSSLLLLQA